MKSTYQCLVLSGLQPKMEIIEELYLKNQISSKLQRLFFFKGNCCLLYKTTGARNWKFQQPDR